MALIANLLFIVLSRTIKQHCAFSQLVTMVRLTLMYYIDFIAFMENPDRIWEDMVTKESSMHHLNLDFSTKGACF